MMDYNTLSSSTFWLVPLDNTLKRLSKGSSPVKPRGNLSICQKRFAPTRHYYQTLNALRGVAIWLICLWEISIYLTMVWRGKVRLRDAQTMKSALEGLSNPRKRAWTSSASSNVRLFHFTHAVNSRWGHQCSSNGFSFLYSPSFPHRIVIIGASPSSLPFHHCLDSFSVTVPPIVPQQSFIFNSTTSPFFVINNDRYRFSNPRPTSWERPSQGKRFLQIYRRSKGWPG